MDFGVFMDQYREDFKQQQAEESLPLFEEIAIDFETGEPLHDGDRLITLTGAEALKVWVFRALSTELGKYEAHSEDYGTEIQTNIGTIYDRTIRQPIMEAQVIRTLMVNPYITRVHSFTFEQDEESGVRMQFSVDTIYGEIRNNRRMEAI